MGFNLKLSDMLTDIKFTVVVETKIRELKIEKLNFS